MDLMGAQSGASARASPEPTRGGCPHSGRPRSSLRGREAAELGATAARRAARRRRLAALEAAAHRAWGSGGHQHQYDCNERHDRKQHNGSELSDGHEQSEQHKYIVVEVLSVACQLPAYIPGVASKQPGYTDYDGYGGHQHSLGTAQELAGSCSIGGQELAGSGSSDCEKTEARRLHDSISYQSDVMLEPDAVTTSYSAGVRACEKGKAQQVPDAFSYSRGVWARDSSTAGVAYPTETRLQAAAAGALRAAAARRAAAGVELGADSGDDDDHEMDSGCQHGHEPHSTSEKQESSYEKDSDADCEEQLEEDQQPAEPRSRRQLTTEGTSPDEGDPGHPLGRRPQEAARPDHEGGSDHGEAPGPPSIQAAPPYLAQRAMSPRCPASSSRLEPPRNPSSPGLDSGGEASPPSQLEDRPEARPGHGGQASGGQEGADDAQLEACGARLELPPTVRSPWRVFEEDLEDEMEEAADKNEEDLAALRARWDTVQTMGAPAAYALLPEDQRKPYEDLTLSELAAYATFLRYGMQGGHSEEVAAEAWCSPTCQEMADWLTDDPRATLAADPRWAPLLRELTDSSGHFPKEQHHPKKVRFYFPEDEDSADHFDAKSG